MTLATALPQGALTWGHDHWSAEMEFMAEIVELLDAIRRQVAASSGSKKIKRQQPVRIKRPPYLETKTTSRRIKSAGDFAAFVRGIAGQK